MVARVHEKGGALHGLLPQVEVRGRAERVGHVVQGQVPAVSDAPLRLQREQVLLVEPEVLQLAVAARQEQVRAAGRAAPPGGRIPRRDGKTGRARADHVPMRHALRAAGGCTNTQHGAR